MRIVHYLNQFFGGKGGEEAADLAPQQQDGAVGPGKLLEQVMGENAQVVCSMIVGDNYAAENLAVLNQWVIEQVQAADADLFVAGPCFEAGRYGVAAGALCAAVQSELGIPVVTGMALENPGVDLHRQELYIVDSGSSVSAMRDVLTNMAGIAMKLSQHLEIGAPQEAGYIPRGILHDAFASIMRPNDWWLWPSPKLKARLMNPSLSPRRCPRYLPRHRLPISPRPKSRLLLMAVSCPRAIRMGSHLTPPPIGGLTTSPNSTIWKATTTRCRIAVMTRATWNKTPTV